MGRNFVGAVCLLVAVFLMGAHAHAGQEVTLQNCPTSNNWCGQKTTLNHSQQIYYLRKTCNDSIVGNYPPSAIRCASGNDTKISCKSDGYQGNYAICKCGWAGNKLKPSEHQQVSMGICCTKAQNNCN